MQDKFKVSQNMRQFIFTVHAMRYIAGSVYLPWTKKKRQYCGVLSHPIRQVTSNNDGETIYILMTT